MRTISTIPLIIAKVFGPPMQSTHSDSCHAEILICTTWGSTTRVCPSTAKERAENRGKQSEHGCGEPPSTGITTTSSRSNLVGSVQVIFEPGPFRLSTAIVWSKLLCGQGLACERSLTA